jgi:2Fe-2S ferredoxin
MRRYTVGSLLPSNQLSPSPNEVISSKEKRNGLLGQNPNEKSEDNFKNKITVLQNNQSYQISPVKNKLLLDTALEQNQKLSYKCRKGTCGVCTVQVIDGYSALLAPNLLEQNKLSDTLGQHYRLACQAMIK